MIHIACALLCSMRSFSERNKAQRTSLVSHWRIKTFDFTFAIGIQSIERESTQDSIRPDSTFYLHSLSSKVRNEHKKSHWHTAKDLSYMDHPTKGTMQQGIAPSRKGLHSYYYYNYKSINYFLNSKFYFLT